MCTLCIHVYALTALPLFLLLSTSHTHIYIHNHRAANDSNNDESVVSRISGVALFDNFTEMYIFVSYLHLFRRATLSEKTLQLSCSSFSLQSVSYVVQRIIFFFFHGAHSHIHVHANDLSLSLTHTFFLLTRYIYKTSS